MKKLLLLLALVLTTNTQVFAGADFERTGTGSTTELFEQADGLSTDFSGVDTTFSIALWAKPENTTTTNQILVSKYDSTTPGPENGRAYRLSTATTDKFYRCAVSTDGTSGTTTATNATVAAADGVLRHVGCIYDDVTLQPYVDGVASGSGAAHTGGVHNSHSKFAIGAQYSNAAVDGSTGWDGILDDVCIHSPAISASEMLDIFTSQRKGRCAEIDPENLKIYCSFDQYEVGTLVASTITCLPGSAMTGINTPVITATTSLNYVPTILQGQ